MALSLKLQNAAVAAACVSRTGRGTQPTKATQGAATATYQVDASTAKPPPTTPGGPTPAEAASTAAAGPPAGTETA